MPGKVRANNVAIDVGFRSREFISEVASFEFISG